jgi:hypothetical protein
VKNNITTYSSILEEFELTSSIRYPWAVVGTSFQVQGWKLHLSSIPREAVRLLRKIVPLLKAQNVSFKVARDKEVLSLLNEGEMGASQVGKFMTIYPKSDNNARLLAKRLVAITKGFHGPIIVTDLKLGDIVYARYGGFNPIVRRDRFGQSTLLIHNHDGSLRTDSYSAPFVLPDGVNNPFVSSKASHDHISEKNMTQVQINDNTRSDRLMGPGYLLVEPIKFHPKGSVFLAIDLRSQEQVGLRIIKEGRKFCLSDEYGRDI